LSLQAQLLQALELEDILQAGEHMSHHIIVAVLIDQLLIIIQQRGITTRIPEALVTLVHIRVIQLHHIEVIQAILPQVINHIQHLHIDHTVATILDIKFNIILNMKKGEHFVLPLLLS
jgi:hypothetical protein